MRWETNRLLLLQLSRTALSFLFLALALLQEGFGDENLVLSRDRSVVHVSVVH